MRISFGDVIGGSFKWMVSVLFKPFNFKKWIILTFIAILAGYLSFNFNCSTTTPGKRKSTLTKEALLSFGIHNLPLESKEALAQSSIEFEEDSSQKIDSRQLENFWSDLQAKITKSPLITILIGVFLLMFLLILLLFMWLSARFKFIFLEDIVENDASIVMPWKQNRKEANNYFVFSVILFLGSLIFIGFLIFRSCVVLNNIGLFESGVAPGFLKVFFCILPYIIIFVSFCIFMGLLCLIIEDFTLPIMYKEKISILKALGRSLSLLAKNIGYTFLYFLTKIGFGILAMIYTFTLLFAILLVIMLIGLVLGIIGVFVYKIMPPSAKGVLSIFLVVVGIPLILSLWFFVQCILLPIPVFFRIFSLRFLAALNERYDLFKLT